MRSKWDFIFRIEHLDGDLILYQRNLDVASPNAANHRKPTWYMKLKIGGGKKPIDRSTYLCVPGQPGQRVKLMEEWGRYCLGRAADANVVPIGKARDGK